MISLDSYPFWRYGSSLTKLVLAIVCLLEYVYYIYIYIYIYNLNLEGIQYDIIDTSSFMHETASISSMKLLVSIMSY